MVINLFRLMAIVCVTAFMAAPADAFQETQISPDATAAAESGASKNAPPVDAAMPGAAELSLPSAGQKPTEGTEINIPGLGKIGVLPKLDFGLDLLYGAKEQSDVNSSAAKEDPTDGDVMIRGTVKHRF